MSSGWVFYGLDNKARVDPQLRSIYGRVSALEDAVHELLLLKLRLRHKMMVYLDQKLLLLSLPLPGKTLLLGLLLLASPQTGISRQCYTTLC
jgi:hypothetical protein